MAVNGTAVGRIPSVPERHLECGGELAGQAGEPLDPLDEDVAAGS
jgi:hypothetical protein